MSIVGDRNQVSGNDVVLCGDIGAYQVLNYLAPTLFILVLLLSIGGVVAYYRAKQGKGEGRGKGKKGED